MLGRNDDVVTSLAESMRALGPGPGGDVEVTLPALTGGALRSVPSADYAAITVAHRKGPIETACATHRHPEALDEIQHRCGQGPVISAWENPVVTVTDLASESRWPRYCRQAVDGTPVRSLICVQMFADRKMLVALMFYAERRDAFETEAVEVSCVFAAFAALAWRLMKRDEQFRQALASRDVIGQAKGMIMERYDIDAAQAFQLLKRLSQNMNIPVAELARRLTDRSWIP